MDTETYLLVRENKVTKANALIQKSRYHLSKIEQRVILYIISKISPEDSEFKQYEFNIPDFCRICGLEDIDGHHKQLKDTLLRLCNSKIWVKEGKKLFTLGWLAYAEIVEGSGTVAVEIDPRMKPYLLQLQEQFTSYTLAYALAFKSKYSIRLYELLKSIENMDLPPSYTPEQLQDLMDSDYPRYYDFKKRSLIPAVQEINEYSDIEVSFVEEKLKKRGSPVKSITFTVRTRNVAERVQNRQKIDKRMGTGGQLTIWEAVQDADQRRHGTQ